MITAGLGRRADALATLANGAWDVLVVGGGIAGAGALLEATMRGQRAALIERSDFASGTSSRSSKLVHGGLRYLARGEVRMVRDALRERAALERIAPEIVRPMPHVFPIPSRGGGLAIRATLALYDLLGSHPRHRVMRRAEIVERGLAAVAPHGAAAYWEAQADDMRLVFATLLAAAARGAAAVNYVGATGRRTVGERVRVVARDVMGGDTFEIDAGRVVVAVGAWLGDERAGFDWADLRLRPAKGIHVVLRVPPHDANVLMRSARDGRYLNTLPWHGHVLAGTTDTPASRMEIDDPRATPEDVAYVLDAVRPLYPKADQQVRAVWAGVRPLVEADAATTAALSREDRVVSLAPSVVAIAGGKLTTYRAMARRALDALDVPQRRQEVHLADPLPATGARLVSDLPYTRDQLETGARIGLVRHLDDLLTHRLGITLLAPDAVMTHADEWARLVAPLVGWSEADAMREAEHARSRARTFSP